MEQFICISVVINIGGGGYVGVQDVWTPSNMLSFSGAVTSLHVLFLLYFPYRVLLVMNSLFKRLKIT